MYVFVAVWRETSYRKETAKVPVKCFGIIKGRSRSVEGKGEGRYKKMDEAESRINEEDRRGVEWKAKNTTSINRSEGSVSRRDAVRERGETRGALYPCCPPAAEMTR